MTAPSNTVRRKRIGKGIYRDRYGIAAAVKVARATRPSNGRSNYVRHPLEGNQNLARGHARRTARGPAAKFLPSRGAPWRPTPRCIWRK